MQIQLKSLDQRILAIPKFRVCLLLLPSASPITKKGIFRHIISALCTARNTQAGTSALLPSPRPGTPKTSATAWGAFSFVNPSFSRVWIVQQRKPVKALQYPLQKAGFLCRLVACACCLGLRAGGRQQDRRCGRCSKDQAEDGC